MSAVLRLCFIFLSNLMDHKLITKGLWNYSARRKARGEGAVCDMLKIHRFRGKNKFLHFSIMTDLNMLLHFCPCFNVKLLYLFETTGENSSLGYCLKPWLWLSFVAVLILNYSLYLIIGIIWMISLMLVIIFINVINSWNPNVNLYHTRICLSLIRNSTTILLCKLLTSVCEG